MKHIKQLHHRIHKDGHKIYWTERGTIVLETTHGAVMEYRDEKPVYIREPHGFIHFEYDIKRADPDWVGGYSLGGQDRGRSRDVQR